MRVVCLYGKQLAMIEELTDLDMVGVALYMRKAHRSHPPRMDGSPYDCHPWDVLAMRDST